MGEDRAFQRALGGLYERGDIIASKYRLDRVVGVGGMGIVLEAEHLDLEQKVAVKLLRPTRKSDDARERFRREAKMAFGLTSEHAARIIDLGQDGDVLFMAMELLDGHDFGHVLEANGRLEVASAVGYILQACEAIAEAHALGIVHRDLKPENLFLCTRADGSPCVKVLDFGLAKWHAQRASLTRVNRGMGTPHYMAPEQWLSARDVGPGSDIWAIGVLLYQMIAGARPFEEEDEGALCQSILFGPPTDLDRYVPNPPEGLPEVIMRCLGKKPDERWPTTKALATALLPYAPAGPVDKPKHTGLPTPGPSSSWGLSLSNDDARDSVTALMPVAQMGARDAMAGATAEPIAPSVRPPAPTDLLLDEQDTSQPVAAALAASPTPKSRALWAVAAIAMGACGAFFLLRPTNPPPAPAPGIAVAAPGPRPVAAPEPVVEPVAEASVVPTAEPDPEPAASADGSAEPDDLDEPKHGAGALDETTAPPAPAPVPRYRPRPRPKPKSAPAPKPKPKLPPDEYIPTDL